MPEIVYKAILIDLVLLSNVSEEKMSPQCTLRDRPLPLNLEPLHPPGSMHFSLANLPHDCFDKAVDLEKRYYVYILECADRTLYTGWTNDIEKRINEHNGGRNGAKYTRGRRPVRLVFMKEYPSLSDALKEEARIKKMSKEQKVQMIAAVERRLRPEVTGKGS